MRTIVLSGFMATGKSSTGARLAARLGLPFVDTDREIEKHAGRPIPELWKSEGEAAFREREALVVRPLLEDGVPRVLAFGGGTVTSRPLRHLALERAVVVTLTADARTIVERAGALGARPNLDAEDPLVRAKYLLEMRAEAYAECHGSVSTEGMDVDAVVDAIVPIAERDPVVVPLGSRTYPLDIVRDLPSRLTDAIARLAPSSLVVVTDSAVQRARGKALDAALAPLVMPMRRVTLAPGEAHKTIASVGAIWDAALGTGVDRDALIVAFGGGVVGDLAGFAASTLLRGVRFVQVPTTLLSMVDSSVGGKTGFDHPAGKNLLGAFHQPSAVVVDLGHLATLPARELAAGLAEVVKIALAMDAPLLETLERDAKKLAAGDAETLAPVVRRAIEAKARVVRDDEREAGLREVLNLGHTLGHALEAHGGYSRHLHGEAVAIGTVLELAATARMGKTPSELVRRVTDLLSQLALPTSVPPGTLASAWSYVSADKKRRGGAIRLPIVTAVGRTEVTSVKLSDLRAAALT